MSRGKGERPERKPRGLGLLVDNLKVIVPVVAPDAVECHRIKIEGDHRQSDLVDESADIFPVIAGQSRRIHDAWKKVQVERMLSAVRLLDPSGPRRKFRESRRSRLVAQEIAEQRRMILDSRHDAVGVRFEFVAGSHNLDTGLLGEIQGSLEVFQRVEMREIDVETAFSQFLIPFESSVLGRNRVPRHNRQGLFPVRVRHSAGMESESSHKAGDD